MSHVFTGIVFFAVGYFVCVLRWIAAEATKPSPYDLRADDIQ